MKTVSFLKKYWVFFLLGIIVVFLYTLNLDKNSRFIWDESRALVDMHRIWENKLITFVGPISADNLEMFPSLSYYLYLPSAILTHFDPLGPAYMAAFYGMIAWILLTITIVKICGVNVKSIAFSLLVATINPILVASRWAWNPNLIIFWFSIFIASLFYDNPFFVFLGGISLGASLYHHYLAALGVLPALLFLPIIYKGHKRKISKIALTFSGFIVSLVPFVLFELKNHYFLNSGHFLSANGKSFLTFSGSGFLTRLWDAVVVFSTMFVPNNFVFIVVFLLILLAIFVLYFKDRIIQYSFITLLLSLLLFGFVQITYPHYQYSQVPLVILLLFRFFYLNKNIFGKLFLAALLAFSLYGAANLIGSYTWQGDIIAVRNITKYILAEKVIKTNVAALVSLDTNTTGQRYRDMTLINGKTLDASDKYPSDTVLYVVSGTNNSSSVMQDGAWEMETFRNSTITNIWKVSDFPLYLYRLEKTK
jgi:hypothetical protein